MKIAGYILVFEIDQGDSWVNSVDPRTTTPSTLHRQCVWNCDLISSDALTECVELTKIPLEEAEKHTCNLCGNSLSAPAYFTFEQGANNG